MPRHKNFQRKVGGSKMVSAQLRAQERRVAPPQFLSNVSFGHTYRFTSTNATATALTGTSILCAAGSMGTVVNTTVTSFFLSFKIKKIEIWTPPASQGAAATCSVDWTGSENFSATREVSDTTVSVDRPAYVSTRPPAQSAAAFWQGPGTATLCTLIAPTGSIVDIQLALILSDGDVAAATTAVATCSVGGTYYLSLDPNATHRYVPVSLATTT